LETVTVSPASIERLSGEKPIPFAAALTP